MPLPTRNYRVFVFWSLSTEILIQSDIVRWTEKPTGLQTHSIYKFQMSDDEIIRFGLMDFDTNIKSWNLSK